MNTIIQLWNIIITSNFFNFIVMVLILIWIVKKTDLLNLLEKAKDNVKQSIEDAEHEKILAENELLNVEKSVENLEIELKEKIQKAEDHAEVLAKSIADQTNAKLKTIRDNIERVLQTEEKTISTRLTQKTAKVASELAKQHIKSVLSTRAELHTKFINQSIEELG